MKFGCFKIAFLILIPLLFSCHSNHQEKLNFASQLEAKPEARADFSLVSQRVLQKYCIKCHSQYSNYNSVLFEANSIKDSITQNRMPKNSRLSEEEKELLLSWINVGAPETTNQDQAVPEPIKIEPTWSYLSKTIFVPKCLVCHNPAGQAKFFDLSSRQKIFDARSKLFFNGQKLIDFESPKDSFLITLVTDPIEPMPPLSSNISTLTSEQVNLLMQWIQLGLP